MPILMHSNSNIIVNPINVYHTIDHVSDRTRELCSFSQVIRIIYLVPPLFYHSPRSS
jgi:hypothetical protein